LKVDIVNVLRVWLSICNLLQWNNRETCCLKVRTVAVNGTVSRHWL